ncbi:MAG: hypothetical protein HFG60_12530 [Lachnospiraceae bacterium]|nr:hypothetical protein [Lachnospiraceae bacterium]
MGFLTGVKRKGAIGIREALEEGHREKTVKMNGAIRNIRDMGDVAFVILRTPQGLVQCV